MVALGCNRRGVIRQQQKQPLDPSIDLAYLGEEQGVCLTIVSLPVICLLPVSPAVIGFYEDLRLRGEMPHFVALRRPDTALRVRSR